MYSDTEQRKAELETEILEISRDGLNFGEVLWFTLELSRCIVKSDFDRLREKINRRKEELLISLS